ADGKKHLKGLKNSVLSSSTVYNIIDSPFSKKSPDVLDQLGERLDSSRREIMLRLDIGLTKLYNLYHDPELSVTSVVKETKCVDAEAEWAIPKIVALRELNKAIDEAVRDAYGWSDIPLQHGFHELEFLPENDRVRYTISNPVRKLILGELLKLNHLRHREELEAGIVDEEGKRIRGKEGKGRKIKENSGQGGLF
ncbi:MAG: hypothetical protein WCQ50_14950, partial [Spirochaetota bacterium]